jgi:hypothetical protein
LGTQYVLGLKAVNCQDGSTLAQQLVTATTKEKVLGALDQATSKLLSQLGESLASLQKFDVPLRELMEYEARMGHYQDAKATYQQAASKSLDHSDLHYFRYAVAFLEGDTAEMQRQRDWAAGKPGREPERTRRPPNASSTTPFARWNSAIPNWPVTRSLQLCV